MKTYQTLTLIGGIFGIAIVPILVLVLSVGLLELFGAIGLITTLVVSITAIIMVFKSENIRTIGYVLLGMAIAMAFATHVVGVISWAFLVAAGISALRYRD
ncbi:MAG: hypothetical protein D9C04_07140 [Nitrosopumilus sp. B06]|nr:MAG: hypothetical protein D9C04_07140 [Nitrosopumilus sp. B06]